MTATDRMTEDGRYLPEGTVLAEEVTEGMFLHGIDNGYVIDVDPDADLRTAHNTSITHGNVTITFNTQDGDEGYLIVPEGTPVRAGLEAA